MSTPWLTEAVHRIERDVQRSADTHLFPIDLPALRSEEHTSELQSP